MTSFEAVTPPSCTLVRTLLPGKRAHEAAVDQPQRAVVADDRGAGVPGEGDGRAQGEEGLGVDLLHERCRCAPPPR